MEDHPARDTPPDRSGFVKTEVDRRGRPQNLNDLLKIGGACPQWFRIGRGGSPGVRQAPQSDKLAGDLLGRQNKIHAPRQDRALRHARISGRLGILGKGNAAFGLDGLQPQRAVGRRAR